MKEVRENLYIGNLVDATAVHASSTTNITHVLNLIHPQRKASAGRRVAPLPVGASADSSGNGSPSAALSSSANGGPQNACAPKIVTLNVPMRDIETQNLIDNIEVCLDFIEKGLASGAVLVHCLAGVSRSAAVVMAYLMKTERLSMEGALESLQEASASVCPNAGFMQQLLMFEGMDFTVDRQSPIYKRFHLENLGEAFGRGEKIEYSNFAPDPGCPTAVEVPEADLPTLSGPASGSEKLPFTVYRCKKCRRLVASEANAIVHSPGGGVTSFAWRKRGGKHPGDDVSHSICSSIFVEPMQWMTSVFEDVVEGKLFCANCQARLGNFNWAGMQCSCGQWVNPAFQLHKSRMDASWL